MATYSEGAATQERASRKAAQDRHLGAQQRQFDAFTVANTDKRGGWKVMKYERAQFAVVTASDAFREGYDQIQWGPRSTDLESNPETGKEPDTQ